MRKNIDKMLLIGPAVFCVVAIITQKHIVRGIMLTLVCIFFWIEAKIDPSGRVFAVSRAGFLTCFTKKTTAIVVSVIVFLYWIATLVNL